MDLTPAFKLQLLRLSKNLSRTVTPLIETGRTFQPGFLGKSSSPLDYSFSAA